MRIAYADPPYVGQAKKHYRNDPSGIPAAEVDHVALFAQLEHFDGWALSASSPSLFGPAGLCAIAPAGARMGSWVKPFGVFRPGVNPAYVWEPVIFKPARSGRRDIPTVRDFGRDSDLGPAVAANITLRKGVHGAKPPKFARWLFDLLGADPSDTFADLFPGSGAVSDEWVRWMLEARAPVSPVAQALVTAATKP